MKYIKIALTLMLMYSNISTFAQLPPADQNFTIDIDDQFSTLNSTTWWVDDDWKHGPGITPVRIDPSNIVTGTANGLEVHGKPISQITHDGINYAFSGGSIHTVFKYTYGYFEAECKFPAAHGFWDCFWLWGAHGPNDPPVSYTWHCSGTSVSGPFYSNEIDIMEPQTSNNQHTVYTNIHGPDHTWSFGFGPISSMPLDIPVPSLNFSDWNVYSCLWTTDKIQIFLNGVMIREIINDCATVDLNYPMEVLFDTYIDFPGFPLPSVDDALMVKHFMAYKLITICDSYAYHGDFSTYAYGVHKDLRIDGPSNVPVGSAVTLRAGTTVVNGLFTVPAGAEFCIMPTTCY